MTWWIDWIGSGRVQVQPNQVGSKSVRVGKLLDLNECYSNYLYPTFFGSDLSELIGPGTVLSSVPCNRGSSKQWFHTRDMCFVAMNSWGSVLKGSFYIPQLFITKKIIYHNIVHNSNNHICQMNGEILCEVIG